MSNLAGGILMFGYNIGAWPFILTVDGESEHVVEGFTTAGCGIAFGLLTFPVANFGMRW